MDHVPRWHTWKGNISDQLCEEFPTCKKQCLIIPGDPPSKMSLHPSKTNIEPKDWSLENPWGPEGNLPFHKGEFQDPCQFYRTRCSECSGSISQLPFQSRTESAQIYDTITVPCSSPCGVSTVSSCLYLDKRDSIGNSEPTNSRANPSPPWGPQGFGSRNCPFPVATFRRVRGFSRRYIHDPETTSSFSIFFL